MITLHSKQIRQLKQLAHKRKVAVSIGNRGLTESVLNEVELTLAHHELIKIKLPAADKAARQTLLAQVAEHCVAQVVQLIGRVGVLYKPAKKPMIELIKIS